MQSRAALTTRTMTMMEEGLGALQAAGLPLPRGLQIIHAVTGLVIGHAIAGGTSADDQKLLRLSEEDLAAFPLLVRAVEERSEERRVGKGGGGRWVGCQLAGNG